MLLSSSFRERGTAKLYQAQNKLIYVMLHIINEFNPTNYSVIHKDFKVLFLIKLNQNVKFIKITKSTTL